MIYVYTIAFVYIPVCMFWRQNLCVTLHTRAHGQYMHVYLSV